MGAIPPIRHFMDWVEGNKGTRALDLATGRIDRFFARICDGYLEKSWLRAKERAIAADPVYAEIEALRKTNSTSILLFDPANPMLGWDAWEYQHSVDAVFQRPSVLLSLARWASNQPLSRMFNDFIAKRQRAQRGWDFRAVYGLDHHVASTLGPQLVEVAGMSVNPADPWVEEMRAAGEALTTYTQKDDIVLGDGVAPKDMLTVEADILEGARQSLHWVAENLTKLSR